MAPGLLHHGLEAAAGRYPDHPALLAGSDTWTFRQLDAATSALTSRLGSIGVGHGDRVAVMTANRPEFVVAVNAVSKLGASAVLLNPAWKALEVDGALALTKPRAAVADGDAVELLSGRPGVESVIDVDEPATERGIGRKPRTPDHAPNTGPGDDAVLVFSSGTTDSPKAVRHTHHSIGHATVHWCRALGLGHTDRFGVATPPSHILGLLNLLAAAAAGATVRLHRRFDLEAVLSSIQSERMTLEMAVAPIALALADHPDLEDYDLSSLRYIMWGATPVTPSVAERVTARTGVRWLAAYGASEVPVIAANPVDQPDRWRLDSVGLPPDGVELRAVALDTGAALGPGQTGEIQVRSESAMAGYLPDEATTDAFSDGWYRTGDVGWLEPGGWVHLTDRCKEMIKVSGFQVAPAEIESVLLGHPAVADCAVFGVADERCGEVPVAAVRLGEPGTRAEDLASLVSDSLASYKHLRHVVVVEDIPRLPSGKVLRRVLREQWEPKLATARAAV
jgi:acyl-CoA synthetase (AMP-forming)/AMP-acid ligase II